MAKCSKTALEGWTQKAEGDMGVKESWRILHREKVEIRNPTTHYPFLMGESLADVWGILKGSSKIIMLGDF